jgi:DMSO/TMAO reductase YedYZ molybdopterin-dependent catalytic subunit
MRKPHVLTGALVGGLVMIALAAVFFAADVVAGLPVVPFDMLDWSARNLPGGLVTFGIDTMVNTLILLNISVRQSAKLAEQGMAVGGMIATGVVAGLVLYAVLRALKREKGVVPGLILGVLMGVPIAAIDLNVNESASAGPVASVIWILIAFLGWGAVVGWAYERLIELPAAKEAEPEKAEPEKAPAMEMAPGGAMSASQLSRRQFLIRIGAGTAAVTVVGAGVASVLSRSTRSLGGQTAGAPSGEAAGNASAAPVSTGAEELLNPLPNADATLEPAPGTRPEYTPLEDHYRIDINTLPPTIDAANWTLAITGLVRNPLELTLDDIQRNYEPVNRFVTLSCISNRLGGDLIGTTLWTGARLSEVLADAQPQVSAQFVRIYAQDMFHETLALDLLDRESDRIMLTYNWDGQPLEQKHGFPLRIYIPDRYGMKQPKWITALELVSDYQEGYWVQRGWSETARVRVTSVIDTVAVDSTIESGGQTLVPIGGIAYSGAKGISKVEVQMDGGEWTEAELREPISDTTWVIWRIDWPFEAGDHTFAVRCYDGDGNLQITEPAPVRPDGATGIFTYEATL